jgi:hypothetical protein
VVVGCAHDVLPEDGRCAGAEKGPAVEIAAGLARLTSLAID